MKEVSREPRITYTLFKIADGTYLHNQSAIDCHNNRNIFTEWQAYEHLLNLPRIV